MFEFIQYLTIFIKCLSYTRYYFSTRDQMVLSPGSGSFSNVFANQHFSGDPPQVTEFSVLLCLCPKLQVFVSQGWQLHLNSLGSLSTKSPPGFSFPATPAKTEDNCSHLRTLLLSILSTGIFLLCPFSSVLKVLFLSLSPPCRPSSLASSFFLSVFPCYFQTGG